MAVKLGYGGIANTNGARSFAGKVAVTGVTISLPAAADVSGHIYFIKKTDSSGNDVTVDPNGSETIDGETTYVLEDQYDSIVIQSDGSNWHIIAGWYGPL